MLVDARQYRTATHIRCFAHILNLVVKVCVILYCSYIHRMTNYLA